MSTGVGIMDAFSAEERVVSKSSVPEVEVVIGKPGSKSAWSFNPAEFVSSNIETKVQSKLTWVCSGRLINKRESCSWVRSDSFMFTFISHLNEYPSTYDMWSDCRECGWMSWDDGHSYGAFPSRKRWYNGGRWRCNFLRRFRIQPRIDGGPSCGADSGIILI